jgi:phosphoenolpyruvate carboxykinase (ATP)
MKDPVARTASPYIDPTIKGPSQILASGHFSATNSKSSKPPSLALGFVDNLGFASTVLANSVNKTGLHPGGVA